MRFDRRVRRLDLQRLEEIAPVQLGFGQQRVEILLAAPVHHFAGCLARRIAEVEDDVAGLARLQHDVAGDRKAWIAMRVQIAGQQAVATHRVRRAHGTRASDEFACARR